MWRRRKGLKRDLEIVDCQTEIYLDTVDRLAKFEVGYHDRYSIFAANLEFGHYVVGFPDGFSRLCNRLIARVPCSECCDKPVQ